MDIIGLGVHLTDLPRIAHTYAPYGERFLQRGFPGGAIAYCMRRRDPVPSLAGRFAVKEAAMKALGTGHSRGGLGRGLGGGRPGGAPPSAAAGGGAAALRGEAGTPTARNHHARRDIGDGAGADRRRLTATAVSRFTPLPH